MGRSTSRDISAPLLHPDRRSRSRPGSRPGSRHGSRSRASRQSTATAVQTYPEDIINPAAPVNEEEVELLQDFVHPGHHHDYTLVEEEGEEEDLEEDLGDFTEDGDEYDPEWKEKLPWWKRPSPWWFLLYVPFAAIAMSITAAAKIELFQYLVCSTHRPVLNPDHGPSAIVSAVAEQVISTYADPRQRACAQDPVVQVAVAKLTVVITTTMGVLTCLTTAWWGSLSDRYGRTRVLSCAVVGVLVMDLNFLCVFWFYNYIPGGYWSLVIGPVVEGAMGGQALINATIHAYLSDCTPPARRSQTFSLYLGLLFTGMGIGPTLGGLVIRFTDTFIYVFYISAVIHVIYAIGVWFVVPESLSRAEMREARARRKIADENYRAAHAQGGGMVFLKRMFGFLTPLSIFLPVEVSRGNPAKGKKKDWSLFLVIVAYGFTVSLVGLYLYMIQFLTGVHGWDTEQVGYWFSSVGVARAVFLTLILPSVLRLVKWWSRPPIQLPTEPNEPLIARSPSSARPPSTLAAPPVPAASRSPSPNPHAPHSPQFDLGLARISLGVEVVVYLLIVLSPTGLTFAVSTALGAFGMGFGPATQAVALALYNQRGGKDSGKLFGAMSVVQAMCSQVFGPFVYGLTYARTAATMPKMIFVVATCAVTMSFILMLFVRLPKGSPVLPPADVEEQPLPVSHVEREDTLVDDAPEPLIVVDDADRGRKVVKP